MTEHKQPSRWARKQACQFAASLEPIRYYSAETLLALYIEQHTPPPADPLREMLRKSVVESKPTDLHLCHFHTQEEYWRNKAEAFIDRLTEAARRNGKGMVL